MFATLKNKIKEETGNDVQILTRRPSNLLLRHQNSFGSTNSVNTEYLTILEQVRKCNIFLQLKLKLKINLQQIINLYRKMPKLLHLKFS